MIPIPEILLILLIITLGLTAIGFKKTVWFISIGYTVSVVTCALFVMFYRNIDFRIYNYLQNLLLILWGGRLGYFLIKREYNSSYNASVKSQTDSSQQLPFIAKTGIWISVSVLYICMYAPALFSLQANVLTITETAVIYFGLVIIAAGVIIEALADYQKSAFKRINPGRFCDTGLYSLVRCPNYLGEILVWLGNFVCALVFLGTWWQWAIALAGLVCIILIMMGSAKRLEKKQTESYGSDTDYKAYSTSVPILFPWIKIYSLQNIKVYLE